MAGHSPRPDSTDCVVPAERRSSVGSVKRHARGPFPERQSLSLGFGVPLDMLRASFLTALLAFGLLAGCLDGEDGDEADPLQAELAGLPWEELGDLVFDDGHEHNLRDLHTEVLRGVAVL